MTTINNIEYTVARDGDDIICMPSDPNQDDHTLVLHNGYSQVRGAAFMQAKFTHQVDEIANDLMVDYVLENESELLRIDL
jgi:hypothetical protein